MTVCVIPARGGSKRIARKNIKNFFNKPMLHYAVEGALKSGLFDQVYVSTEDPQIAEVAVHAGVKVLIRKPELADDYSTTVAVIADAIHQLGLDTAEYNNSVLACIYPCVPFMLVDDLQQAMHKLLENKSGAGYCFPVTQFPSAIQRALKINEQGQMHPFDSENIAVRTQDLEPAYYDAGQFYLGRISAWLSGESPHVNGLGSVIPSWRVVDIDTPEDWQRAELIYRALFSQEFK